MNIQRVRKVHGHQDTMSAGAGQRSKTNGLRPATRYLFIWGTLLILSIYWLCYAPPAQTQETNLITNAGFENEFPVGVFSGDYPDEDLRIINETGFNYVFTFGLGPHTTYDWQWDDKGNIKIEAVINEAVNLLNNAKNKKLKVAVYINSCKVEGCSRGCNGGDWIYRTNQYPYQILRDFVGGIKTNNAYSALGFWLLSDEPEQHCVEPGYLSDFYDILKDETPEIKVANVHCSGAGWEKYPEAEDIIMPDSYPVTDLEFPQTDIDSNHIVNAFKYAADVNVNDLVMPVYQCYKDEDYTNSRCPVYEEVRYWLFTALGRGARGVFFFNFGTGLKTCGGEDYFKKDVFKPAVGEFNNFISLVKPDYKPTATIYGLERGENVLAVFKRTAGTFVILANRSEGRVEPDTLTLDTKGQLKNKLLLPWGKTRNVSVKIDASGQLTVEAQPWEVFVWKACDYGDVNQDGLIRGYDAALAARLAVGLDELTAEKLEIAEVSGDGEVTAFDAALIAQRAVGLRDKFPVEE